ncbi:hypothetical protein ACEUDM_20115, partial [Aeromonas caviae]
FTTASVGIHDLAMSARRSLTRGIGELLRLLDPGLSDLVRTPQSEFTPKGQQQADLFAPSSAQSDALMAVMDQIKAKGLGRVGLASQGTGPPIG